MKLFPLFMPASLPIQNKESFRKSDEILTKKKIGTTSIPKPTLCSKHHQFYFQKHCSGLQILICLHRFHAVAILSARFDGSSVGDRMGLRGRDTLDGDGPDMI